MTLFPWGLIPRPSGAVATGGAEDCSPAYTKLSKMNLQYPAALRRGVLLKAEKAVDKSKLAWKEEGKKKVFDSPIFSIRESYSRSPENELRTCFVIDAADWVIVVPVLETPKGKKFVMVRQWRHGSQSLSLEFPGGVSEPGENPENAAAREMLEETGYRPGTLRKIGEFNPNPAIMSNRTHFFLAENLVNTGSKSLDPDEYVETELVEIKEVMRGMGGPPFIHALMGSAMSLYLKIEG